MANKLVIAQKAGSDWGSVIVTIDHGNSPDRIRIYFKLQSDGDCPIKIHTMERYTDSGGYNQLPYRRPCLEVWMEALMIFREEILADKSRFSVKRWR